MPTSTSADIRFRRLLSKLEASQRNSVGGQKPAQNVLVQEFCCFRLQDKSDNRQA